MRRRLSLAMCSLALLGSPAAAQVLTAPTPEPDALGALAQIVLGLLWLWPFTTIPATAPRQAFVTVVVTASIAMMVGSLLSMETPRLQEGHGAAFAPDAKAASPMDAGARPTTEGDAPCAAC